MNRNIFNIVFGLIMLSQLVYKLLTCPACDDRIFGFSVPGYAKIIFYIVLMLAFFYPVFKDKFTAQKED
jgi:hypothetical protein